MGILHRICSKVVGLFKGQNTSRHHRREEWEEHHSPRRTHRFDTRRQAEGEPNTPSQHIRAYLANNGFNLRSDADICAYFDNDAASICSSSDSVYSCSNLNNFFGDNSYRIPAKSVREQVKAAPSRLLPAWRYPKHHTGFEHRRNVYRLTARRPWVEFPILNSRDGRGWREKQDPGHVRAVYNNDNRGTFDVIYHDPTAEKRGKHHPFTMAIYRPATRGKETGSGNSRENGPMGDSTEWPSLGQADVLKQQPPGACRVEIRYERTVTIVKPV